MLRLSMISRKPPPKESAKGMAAPPSGELHEF